MKDTFLQFTTLNWREMKGNTLTGEHQKGKRETESFIARFDKHSEIHNTKAQFMSHAVDKALQAS